MEIMEGIVGRLAADGALVIGSHEPLPPGRQLVAPGEIPSVYRLAEQ
jgi:hypothetical protein